MANGILGESAFISAVVSTLRNPAINWLEVIMFLARLVASATEVLDLRTVGILFWTSTRCPTSLASVGELSETVQGMSPRALACFLGFLAPIVHPERKGRLADYYLQYARLTMCTEGENVLLQSIGTMGRKALSLGPRHFTTMKWNRGEFARPHLARQHVDSSLEVLLAIPEFIPRLIQLLSLECIVDTVSECIVTDLFTSLCPH